MWCVQIEMRSLVSIHRIPWLHLKSTTRSLRASDGDQFTTGHGQHSDPALQKERRTPQREHKSNKFAIYEYGSRVKRRPSRRFFSYLLACPPIQFHIHLFHSPGKGMWATQAGSDRLSTSSLVVVPRLHCSPYSSSLQRFSASYHSNCTFNEMGVNAIMALVGQFLKRNYLNWNAKEPIPYFNM